MEGKRITLLLLIACLGFIACDSEDLRGDVVGTIIDSVTEEPLEGVLVECRSLKNNRIRSDETDAGGDYRVTDATYGLNEATMTLEGYYEATRYADVEKDRSIRLDLEMVRILDTRELNVRVDVSTPDGGPIQGARVALFLRDKDEFGGTGYVDTFLDLASTNAQGRAVILEAYTLQEQLIAFVRLDVAAVGFESVSLERTISYERPNLTLDLQLEPLP